MFSRVWAGEVWGCFVSTFAPFYIGMGLLETDCRTCAAGRASENRKRHQRPGCGSQRPLRDRPCGTRVLLAAAPTAPPCFGRRPRSSPLPETWAGRLHTLPTNHRCFIFEALRRSAEVLLLGGSCVQDHLHAGLAAESCVDGQIIGTPFTSTTSSAGMRMYFRPSILRNSIITVCKLQLYHQHQHWKIPLYMVHERQQNV